MKSGKLQGARSREQRALPLAARRAHAGRNAARIRGGRLVRHRRSAEDPAAIAEKVAAGVAEALRNPDVLRRLNELSAEPMGFSPAETAAFMKQETERWGGVIRSAGVKLD